MEDIEEQQNTESEPEMAVTCIDEDVLKGNKVCYCCTASCPYYRLVPKVLVPWIPLDVSG